jgi:hypothetical protein
MSNRSRKRAKAPVAKAKPKARKRPVAGTHVGDQKTVVWALSYVDMDGDWGWSSCDGDSVEMILRFLKELESCVHTEVFGSRHKFIKIESLCPQAQKRLEEIELDDLDGLWELHLSGKVRIWGHRVEHVFYLVWWDPEHTVCPSRKKHT